MAKLRALPRHALAIDTDAMLRSFAFIAPAVDDAQAVWRDLQLEMLPGDFTTRAEVGTPSAYQGHEQEVALGVATEAHDFATEEMQSSTAAQAKRDAADRRNPAVRFNGQRRVLVRGNVGPVNRAGRKEGDRPAYLRLARRRSFLVQNTGDYVATPFDFLPGGFKLSLGPAKFLKLRLDRAAFLLELKRQFLEPGALDVQFGGLPESLRLDCRRGATTHAVPRRNSAGGRRTRFDRLPFRCILQYCAEL